MKLSVVTTLYKSERFVKEFYDRTKKNVLEHTDDYEIIFVNDGSPDHSNLEVLKIREFDKKVKLIELSRNFGHHYAIQAGLTEVSGDLIFLIDSDLETSPEILTDLFSEFNKEEDLDVVYAYQENRKGNHFEKISGKLFYILLNKLSEIEIPHNILTERIMTKNYVDSLLRLGDASLFLGGMMHWVGFNQKGISVKKSQRKGDSTYTISKRISLLVNAIASFSGKPLTWLFTFGISIMFVSFIIGITLISIKFYYGDYIQVGWTSLLVINIFILGVLSTFLGIIGMYLNKIFKQVQSRPNYIIKKKYE